MTRDIHHDHRLNTAAYAAMKNGHEILMWNESSINTGGRRRYRPVVVYKGSCYHCGMEVEYIPWFDKYPKGDMLQEPCMVNTGYEERTLTSPEGDCIVVRLDDVRREYVVLRECA